MHKRNTVVRRPESSNLTNHTSSEQTNETQKWWVNGGAHSFCSLQPSHAQLHMHTSEPGDAHVLHHSSHWMRINACVCGCGEQKNNATATCMRNMPANISKSIANHATTMLTLSAEKSWRKMSQFSGFLFFSLFYVSHARAKQENKREVSGDDVMTFTSA